VLEEEHLVAEVEVATQNEACDDGRCDAQLDGAEEPEVEAATQAEARHGGHHDARLDGAEEPESPPKLRSASVFHAKKKFGSDCSLRSVFCLSFLLDLGFVLG
jgi:hypothetical protein